MYKLCSLIIFTIIISGCSTSGLKFSQAPAPDPESKALVYVMRNVVGYGGAYWTNFYVDDIEIAELYDSGYSWIHVTSGKHIFSMDAHLSPKREIILNIIPGETYYLMVNHPWFTSNNSLEFVHIDSSKGEAIIKGYSYKAASPEAVKLFDE